MTRHRVRLAALCGVFVALLAVTPLAVVGADLVTLEVTVVDGNGDTLDDIDLTATWENGSAAETTSASGKALIDVGAGANVSITVEDETYIRNEPYNLTNATNDAFEVPVAQTGSATVEVVDSDGAAVSDAIVRMRSDNVTVINAFSGDDGTTQSGDIEEGTYTVKSWARGYLRNETTVSVENATTHRVQLTQSSRSLAVSVTDDHFDSPRPVKNATVTVSTRGSSLTLPDGTTSFPVPVNADYDITVTKDGYETNQTSITVKERARRVNVTIQRMDSISVQTANERVVSGETVRVRITDAYEEPVADADVRVDGEDVAVTDADGAAVVNISGAGTHTVTGISGDLTANTTVEGVDPGGGESSDQSQDTVSTTSGFGPGFSFVAGVAGLLLATMLARRR
jgi:PGF-CTERM protein